VSTKFGNGVLTLYRNISPIGYHFTFFLSFRSAASVIHREVAMKILRGLYLFFNEVSVSNNCIPVDNIHSLIDIL